jgi:hypothetical protein
MPNGGAQSEWRELYEAAARETDLEKLTALIEAVESALMNRQQELSGQSGHESELQEMKAAGQKLLFIKTEKLGWPKINLDRQ